MDGNPPTGEWVLVKGVAPHWNWGGGNWEQEVGPLGSIRPLLAWMHNMRTWGTLVAAKTAELEDRIEKLETELKNMGRTVT